MSPPPAFVPANVIPITAILEDRPPRQRIGDVFRHPSLQTKVRASKIRVLSSKRTESRRLFMKTLLLLVVLFLRVFWPIARLSKIKHAAAVRSRRRLWGVVQLWNATAHRNATRADEPVLWDSACKNEDVLG
jgi:hypothetical protein